MAAPPICVDASDQQLAQGPRMDAPGAMYGVATAPIDVAATMVLTRSEAGAEPPRPAHSVGQRR
jgi:hypothetical protein